MYPQMIGPFTKSHIENSNHGGDSRRRSDTRTADGVRRRWSVVLALALSGLLFLPALAPAADAEWSLGLRFADDSALGFQQGLEVIGGSRWHLSRHLGLQASANVGTITKADADGSSWGYSLETLIGGDTCWARVGVSGSGYSATADSEESFSKSVVAPLLGFACDSFNKRIRWGVVAAARPALSSGFGDDEDEPWSISFPISYQFADGKWRYGSVSSVTQGLSKDLWSWGLFIERRWR